jgi:hypothetical protein
LRLLWVLAKTIFASASAYGASIDPAATAFPWMNGPARDSRYDMAASGNKVHVFEAYSISCAYCNSNAEQVQALATEYGDNARVQFLDLGLDSADRDYTSWINRHQPTYPVVKDVGHAVWNALKQENSIPQTFVVDCRGELVDYTIGEWGNAEKAQLRQAIATALETTCDQG